MHLCASRFAEFGDAGARGVEADDPLEVGDRDEEWSVGVTGPEDGVDLEHRMDRIARIDAGAVIDDPLEDRQRPESHATMLADASA